MVSKFLALSRGVSIPSDGKNPSLVDQSPQQVTSRRPQLPFDLMSPPGCPLPSRPRDEAKPSSHGSEPGPPGKAKSSLIKSAWSWPNPKRARPRRAPRASEGIPPLGCGPTAAAPSRREDDVIRCRGRPGHGELWARCRSHTGGPSPTGGHSPGRSPVLGGRRGRHN